MTETSIELRNIEAAESVLGVAYTATERAQMTEGLAMQIARAHRLRGTALPEDLTPASRFDPRLPGFVMPTARGVATTPVTRTLPDNETDIAFASLVELSHWLRTGQISSVKLTELYLARIARFGPKLECIALVTPGRAMRQAQAADAKLAAGEWLGPLHGVPYGLKDLFDTAGLPTSWGAETHLDRLPAEDAAIVHRLEAAGAVLVAKTTLGALAYGMAGGRAIRGIWRKARLAPPLARARARLRGCSGSQLPPKHSARSATRPHAAAAPGCARHSDASAASARWRWRGRWTRWARSVAAWRTPRSCSTR